MKKLISLVLVLLISFSLFSFSGCSKNDANKVIIFSGAEEYRNDYFRAELKKEFPDYDVVIEEMSTGPMATKIATEGSSTLCDMVYDLEYGHIEKIKEYLEDLSEYDMSMFVDEMVLSDKKILPETRNGGCIAINPEMLESRGLSKPTSYADLLKPEYKGLLSMPNPKASGTGYMFLKNLVNVMGEDEAFEYFDKLSKNLTAGFTSSGSGPVNALVQGESAIGLAMTSQTVIEINKGAKLEILFFEEGSPYSLYGTGIIKGKKDKKAVKDVFDYFYNVLIEKDKELYYPEKVYKDKDFEIDSFPTNIKYADMTNNTPEEKERLLAKWSY